MFIPSGQLRIIWGLIHILLFSPNQNNMNNLDCCSRVTSKFIKVPFTDTESHGPTSASERVLWSGEIGHHPSGSHEGLGLRELAYCRLAEPQKL